MKVKSPPLSHYTHMIHQGTPFTYARYGDGEWLTILGGQYLGMRNSNGCTFTQALSQDLRETLQPGPGNYYHAILGIAKRKKGQEIQDFLDQDPKRTQVWYNGDLLLDASLAGDLFPLVEKLRDRRILYVGNTRLRGLNLRGLGFFPYVAYIEPPPQNAHQVKGEILYEVRRIIRKHKIDLVGWSSGLASKVFMWDIWERFPEVTQIDFGSMFDGYFPPLDHIQEMGRSGSRSYIRKGGHDWETLLAQNTQGKGNEH